MKSMLVKELDVDICDGSYEVISWEEVDKISNYDQE